MFRCEAEFARLPYTLGRVCASGNQIPVANFVRLSGICRSYYA